MVCVTAIVFSPQDLHVPNDAGLYEGPEDLILVPQIGAGYYLSLFYYVG